MSSSTHHAAKKLFKIRPYKRTVVRRYLHPGCEARIQYCTSLQGFDFNGFLDPQLMFRHDEGCFTPSAYVRSKLARRKSSCCPGSGCRKARRSVGCAIGAERIIELVFPKEAVNSGRCVCRFASDTFFDQLTEEEKCTGISRKTVLGPAWLIRL